MSQDTSRVVRLRRRPEGRPTPSDFEVAEVEIPEPDEGEVRVRNLYMSVDPYMRGRMRAGKSYADPFEVGEVMYGGAVGVVESSRSEGFEVGDHVLSRKGWREHFLSDGSDLQTVDGSAAPLSAYLGVLGMPGLTAYVGLLDIAGVAPGETVFVSGAAGAVGSVVCQIAKGKGCRVVGSAGSPEKIEWLEETAGIDAGVNYKDHADARSLQGALLDAAPDGLDVYFDNVGGDHLEAAIGAMNDFGRIACCGAISVYNAEEPPPGPRNLFLIVARRLKIQGFLVFDHNDRRPDFYRDMSEWIADGTVTWEETVYEGIEEAPEAFIGLFTGENLGKMVVRLGEE
ncbi:MAG: NADP-dependent oxidoreductase [Longimicrobiales bacterium]|nr:NADP-dependent oxidoreductase [Longimicrobiales bacterium]